jgi:hypothetical protein
VVHYKPLGLKRTDRKRKTVAKLLGHPSSSGISSTGKLERRTVFNRTNHHLWSRTPDRIMYHTKLSPRNGIGSCHHPYASFKVDYTKGITIVQEDKLGFSMHVHHQVYHLPNFELGPFQHLGLPVQHTPSKTTKSV